MTRIFYVSSLLMMLCVFKALPEQKFVTVRTWGELGNQITMVSTALAYAWENGYIPVFPELSERQDHNIPINKRDIFFRLDTNTNYNIKWKEVPLSFFYSPIPLGGNIKILPWGLDIKYFDHHRKNLLQVFKPSQSQIDTIKTKYPSLFSEENTVGVHVRVAAAKSLPFCGFQYFKDAVQLFPENSVFYVASNRIGWVKKHIEEIIGLGKRIVFLEGEVHTQDFNVLRLCKNNIICGSTFSFWAAYLSEKGNKLVVAPSLWLDANDPRTKIGWPGKTKNLYPENWTVLEVPLERFNPPDIESFCSTSVNS